MSTAVKTEYNKKIKSFEDVIKTRKGVLFVKGRPGEAKTAIMHAIAKKNGWQIFDKRLAQVDSAEVGGIPYREEIKTKDGRMVNVMKYSIPDYLVLANEKPTLIIFDELNRASKETRDAALQILNERRVGDFQLNENVYMVAMGNLGDADGTEVEEFDTALKNRLIPKLHELTLAEWRQGYADEHVHPLIIGFVESDPSYLYRMEVDRDSFPTPRSWDNFSALLKTSENHEELIEFAKEHGAAYVGSASIKFIHYVQDQSALNINDVLDNFAGVKVQLKKINRDKTSELINALTSKPLKKMTDVQMNNVIAFLKMVHPDEVSGFFNKIMDRGLLTDDDMINDKKIGKLIAEFFSIIETLQRKLQNK